MMKKQRLLTHQAAKTNKKITTFQMLLTHKEWQAENLAAIFLVEMADYQRKKPHNSTAAEHFKQKNITNSYKTRVKENLNSTKTF